MNKKNTHTALIATLSLFALSACDKGNEEDIPISEVPANIISVVQNALPGIALTEAEKETKEDVVIYELEGKLLNGKEYEIKIDQAGAIIKIELED